MNVVPLRERSWGAGAQRVRQQQRMILVGGEIRMSREIVRPRKAAETGGEGGAKISCNH